MKKYSNLRKDLIMCKELEIKPNYSFLAQKHDVDWRTVKKYNNGYEGKATTRNKTSYLDKYYDEIKSKLEIDGIKISALYQYLLKKDFNIGCYSNFNHYVKKNNLDIKRSKNIPHPRYETEFGEQLQFDWIEDFKLVNKFGELFEFNIFSAILSASRQHIFVYSKTKTRVDVERCLVETFRRIDGVTEKILTDNMSSIVNTKTKKFVPEFYQFCKDMNTMPKNCKVKHPETKGKVESQNRFMAWLVPYNGEFETELEIIEIIKNINKTINLQTNSTTGVSPLILFNKEKEYLHPLPSKEILKSYENDTITAIVSNGFLVYYRGIQYSVPPQFINKTVELYELNNKLYINYNKKLITCHDIKTKKINYLPEHYSEGLRFTIKDEEKLKEQTEINLQLFERMCCINE